MTVSEAVAVMREMLARVGKADSEAYKNNPRE